MLNCEGHLQLIRDEWLSLQLDTESYQTKIISTESKIKDSEIQEIEITNSLKRPYFLYTKIPTNQMELAYSFQKFDYQVVDVNMVFEREPSIQKKMSDGINVRIFSSEDREDVLEIASTTFLYSRFHLDPLIQNEQANKIKRAWIENYIKKERGDYLWVSEYKNQVAGFYATMSVSENNERTNIIDLIGVSPQFKGQGIGRSLVNNFIGDSLGKFKKLRIGTQAANIPSIRLYETCGFQLVDSQYVLHAHRKEKTL